MAEFLQNELRGVGAQVRAVDLVSHLLDGQELTLPPAIFAEIGNDPSKKTILCYGHYDVQPVRIHIPNHFLIVTVNFVNDTDRHHPYLGIEE